MKVLLLVSLVGLVLGEEMPGELLKKTGDGTYGECKMVYMEKDAYGSGKWPMGTYLKDAKCPSPILLSFQCGANAQNGGPLGCPGFAFSWICKNRTTGTSYKLKNCPSDSLSTACMIHIFEENRGNCYNCCDCGGPFAKGMPVCTPLHASIVEQP